MMGLHDTEVRLYRPPVGSHHSPYYVAQSAGRARKGSTGDLVAAAVAGAAAVWLMDRFDWFAFSHEAKEARQRTESVRPGPGLDPAHALAEKIAELAGTRLSPAQPHRHPAGLAVHYAIPIGLTYLYMVLRRRLPVVQRGRGVPFGIGTFLLLDQVVNPALGFAAHPRRYPWQRNARELAAHCIYGFVIDTALSRFESVRTSVRKISSVPSVQRRSRRPEL